MTAEMNEGADAITDAEWQETLDRRWEEVGSGRVECTDALAVIDEIKAQIRAQAAHSS